MTNVVDWIDEGMVDAYFSRALAGTPVRIVNLRESSAPVSELAGRRRDR